jgi:menaquinone-dependent protoporphyrinogen oxidase
MAVLVACASKHGSTTEVARRIAAALIENGVDAKVMRVDDVVDIAGYDAVVIGSSVYFGHWMREAIALVERNRARLAGRPIWLFSVGPLGDQARTDPAEIEGLAASVGAVEHHLFSGALDLHRLSLPERVIVKGVKAPTGDFRDWNEIDSWAAGIASRLEAASQVELK